MATGDTGHFINNHNKQDLRAVTSSWLLILVNASMMSSFVPRTDDKKFLNSLLFDNSSEEDEEEEEEELFFLAALCTGRGSSNRLGIKSVVFVRDRLEWEEHVAALQKEASGSFRRMYRMDIESFVKLASMLEPHLNVDEKMSKVRTTKGKITTEIALHCLIRWLAGGSYIDIRLSAGISRSSFYRCIHSAMNAISSMEQISRVLSSFPPDDNELSRLANDFKDISGSGGILNGCVGVIDGFLLQTCTPSVSGSNGNVKAFFSGHYQCYGVNIQGICDSKCRFIFLASAAPGGCNDIVAYRRCGLQPMINSLPLGRYIIGDNAYVCSEHLLTPFSGNEKFEARKDAFNFYISQLRIRIEMAFGMMTNKFQILKRPVTIGVHSLGKFLLTIGKLHNYCIDERHAMNMTAALPSRTPVAYIRTSNDDDNSTSSTEGGPNDYNYLPSDVSLVDIEGSSMMRDLLVEKIASAGLRRPGRRDVQLS